jgi:hypothetical protein
VDNINKYKNRIIKKKKEPRVQFEGREMIIKIVESEREIFGNGE